MDKIRDIYCFESKNNIIQIHSVSEYLTILNILNRICNGSNSYCPSQTRFDFIFRGHSDINYDIIPSLFREDAIKEREKTYIYDFFRYQYMIKENISSIDYLSVLTLAQHYGIPTRLLDWTANPLVALFFSCKNNDTDGCVWVLQKTFYQNNINNNFSIHTTFRDYINHNFSSSANFNFKMPVIFYPNFIDNRMRNQNSVFMLWGNIENPFDDNFYKHNAIDITSTENSKKCIYKLEIPSSYKHQILVELDWIGINDSFIFYDMPSVSKTIKTRNSPKYETIDISVFPKIHLIE